MPSLELNHSLELKKSYFSYNVDLILAMYIAIILKVVQWKYLQIMYDPQIQELRMARVTHILVILLL
jgi:hypothetical protein